MSSPDPPDSPDPPTPEGPASRAAVFRQLGVALLGVLAGVALVDRAVGWLDRGEVDVDSSLFAPDEELGWVNKPGFDDGQRHTDALGLRNPDVPADASADEVRILVSGASNVFGLGVADGDTWRDRLEEDLRARYGDRVRVLNAAVQGHSLVQQSLLVTRLLDALRPDLLIVFVYPGRQSLLDRAPALKWHDVGGMRVPDDVVAGWPEPLAVLPATAHTLLKNSNLYIRQRSKDRVRNAEGYTNFVLSRAPLDAEAQEALDETRQELERLLQRTRERGIETRFVLVPDLYESNDRIWPNYLRQNQSAGAPPIGTPRDEPISALADWLRPTGVAMWSFYPAVSYIGTDWKTFVLPKVRHWSPRGHRVIATALARHMEQEGLLDRLLERRAVDPRER